MKNPLKRKDRRIHTRLDNVLMARIRILGDKVSKSYTGITKNIGEGGFCIELTGNIAELIDRLDKDTTVFETYIEIPDFYEPLKFMCKVKWFTESTGANYPSVIGLALKDLKSPDYKKFLDYMVKEFTEEFGSQKKKGK